MKTLTPTHVVFNGARGALTGDNAMTADVGDTVLFIHSTANRDTRPHLIGGHGDHVWERGKFTNPPQKDLETWFVAGGSAAVATYTFLQPGIYAYVNHNLIEAAETGRDRPRQGRGTVEQRPDDAGLPARSDRRAVDPPVRTRPQTGGSAPAQEAPMRRSRLLLLIAASLSGMALLQGFTDAPLGEGLVRIDATSVRYREPGEFLDGSTPINGPIGEIRVETPFDIMDRQVTRGEYDRCVAASAC